MPSVVHGPGKHEGREAELPPRPSSLWESLAAHTDALKPLQLRRVAMLLLAVACGWRLDAIGKLFGTHKGHVSREIERARLELSEMMGDQVPVARLPAKARARSRTKLVYVRLTEQEAEVIRDRSDTQGLPVGLLARSWMLTGGLIEAVEGPPVIPVSDEAA